MKKLAVSLLSCVLLLSSAINLTACDFGGNGGACTEHVLINHEAKTPTCTEAGWSAYVTCENCDYTTYEVLPAGHTEITHEGQAPTCTGVGWNEYVTCEYCDYTTYRELSARHTYGNDNVCDDCDYIRQYTRIETNGNESATGEYILFGSYPQSEVTDSALVSSLNALAGTLPTSSNSYTWTSYGYYQGTGNPTAGAESNTTNFIWYQDVEYNGAEYRAVYFTSYRLYYTDCGSSSSLDTKQDDNGYTTGNVYWFQYEPIKWKIIGEEEGYATLLCELLIDSQDYNYKYHNGLTIDGEIDGNNYEYSSIRKWLNDNFYNTAFEVLEQAIIQTVTVDNSAASAGSSTNEYACNDTQDKIWLLSYMEASELSGTERQKKSTDYAKSQGISVYNSSGSAYNGCGYWWLRSPYHNSGHDVKYVTSNGSLIYTFDYVSKSSHGICPALKIKL